MARNYIGALVLDENNLAEMARHGVSSSEVEQVIFNHHITTANPRGEPGSILLIGQADSGIMLTVPLARTDDVGTWRPATAFEASPHQRTLFRRHAR